MAGGLSISAEFMILFNQLKEAAGTPERMVSFYADSRAVRDAFYALREFLEGTGLERILLEGHGRKVVISRTVGFESAWAEYTKHWRFRVSYPIEADGLDLTEEPEIYRERMRNDGHLQPIKEHSAAATAGLESLGSDTAAIEQGIDDLRELIKWRLDYDRGYLAKNELFQWEYCCSLPLDMLDKLIDTIGLDIPGTLRRWRTVPVTLIPSHVSNRYGSDKGSLPNLLDDAVRAYVFDAPAAAIAMCRAALEMVLKQHYLPDQENNSDLSDLIVLADKQYNFVQARKIDPIRKTANGILHKYNKVNRVSEEDERTIVNFLKTVRYLIHRAPKR